jgi:8-oxo-dGTP pyrophosphatase MutT (NUDIX family)
MPIPPYVSHLRTMIGRELLWMPGVTAVVLREKGGEGGGAGVDGGDGGGRGGRQEVLLVRRSDNGAWTPVTGIVDPGEHPHVTAVREVAEEASVVAEVERLVWVSATGVVTHVNGDLGQYLDHTFRCRWVSGDPAPGDDEATEAGWFALDALPEMAQRFLDRIAVAVDNPPDVRLG